MAEPQHHQEHIPHARDMALTEPGDHGVVGNGVADNEAVAGIASAQPLDDPARADAVRIGVEQ